MLFSTPQSVCLGLGLSLVQLPAAVVAQIGKPSSIVGFSPLTDVRDQNRIDLDQRSINQLCDAGDFVTAQKIYEQGSHSKSVSTVAVTTEGGIPIDIEQGVPLTGANANGDPVYVFAQGTSYTTGDAEFSIQYFDEGCYVGPNPTPTTENCLSSNGTLTIDLGEEGAGTTFEYSYDPLTSFNVYNIQRFVGEPDYRFAPGEPLTRDFQKYVDFYGSTSYGDDIITAGFEGTATDFPTGKNIDASIYSDEARAEIATKGTAILGVWMYVIRELEHAIYLCETGDCGEESCLGKAAVHEVDEAAAFYAGSLEGSDGTGDGVLLYDLADRRAADFKTAGRDGTQATGTAKVNHDLLELLESASAHIVTAGCAGVREDTTEIVQIMSIPLVQSTLRYSYKTRTGVEAAEKDQAERAIYAAAILPFVSVCNAADADIIYEATKTGVTNTDFQVVKTAFENNYECMGITGADIGGLWDAETNSYFEGGEPLGFSEGEGNNSGVMGAFLRLKSFAMLTVTVIVLFSI